jgi:hypothetical protein
VAIVSTVISSHTTAAGGEAQAVLSSIRHALIILIPIALAGVVVLAALSRRSSAATDLRTRVEPTTPSANLRACARMWGTAVGRMRERDRWAWTCHWSSGAGRPILVVNEWFAGSFRACVRRCIAAQGHEQLTTMLTALTTEVRRVSQTS